MTVANVILIISPQAPLHLHAIAHNITQSRSLIAIKWLDQHWFGKGIGYPPIYVIHTTPGWIPLCLMPHYKNKFNV